MKEYLQIIANKPLPEQIEILENYLDRCHKNADILAVGKLIRDKKLLLKTPPAQPIKPPPAAPNVGEEVAARIAHLCQKLRWYLLNEQWEEIQKLLRTIAEEKCELSQEQLVFLQDVVQKLKAQQQKSLPPPVPNKRQIALGKLSILITNGNLQPAQQIADSLILENDDFWASPDVDKFQKLLVELKKLETAEETEQNLPTHIQSLEKEIKILQEKKP